MDFTSFIFWSSVFSSNQEEYQPKKPSPEHFRHLTKTNVELEKKLKGKFRELVFSELQQKEKREEIQSLFSEIKNLYDYFGIPFISRKSLYLSGGDATYEKDAEFFD